ncbi:MAG TPA: group II intron reverse transcriptase/maturase [Acidimicrobiales bacterium]|nr:group II intron reverse transcriptase/maturase [Acidimicrobiales bacterium]
MNTDAPWPSLDEAEQRVLDIQTKLHQWAIDDPNRRFDDLHNLVCDPAFLVVAWNRIRGNRGARTAGVDGVAPRSIVSGGRFLVGLRDDLKARRFVPLPVREKLIPKRSGKLRGLGIPTARDRTVQASLKLVLEPIFEADFKPCSYGFRPKRRAHDAVAEIVHMTTGTRNYEWVLEGDIKACFDEIDHTALMGRVRRRIGDKRVLDLVKAFLKAGVLSEDGVERDTIAGTPQGGIVSPLLANIALSILDEHFAEAWQAWGAESARWRRRRRGLPTYRLVRYADDFVVMVAGTRADTEALRVEVAAVIRPMGLRLSEEKTVITHIEQGFDFLGWRIQRQRKRGAVKRYTYTFPSKDSLARVKAKVRTLTRGGTNVPLKVLLYRLNPVLRGWTNYFRPGSSSQTFGYLGHISWWRVVLWLRRKHPRSNWKQLRARYHLWSGISDGDVALFNPESVGTTRYRYRGARIPSPWSRADETVVA